MTDVVKINNHEPGAVVKISGTAIGSVVAVCGMTISQGGQTGVFAGGYATTAPTNVMDYITISTPSNATNFGDLTVKRGTDPCGADNGSTGRGIFAGGRDSTEFKSIDYVTISTPANATDFGDMLDYNRSLVACSNNTSDRGIIWGGYRGARSPDRWNVIQYITISSTGNATNFGDMIVGLWSNGGALSNGTGDRGVHLGGNNQTAVQNIIQYITISAASNATDFGDLSAVCYVQMTTSNLTNNRGINAAGHLGGAYTNAIEYITINSLGNSTTFGDLSLKCQRGHGVSNGVNNRGVFNLGYNADTSTWINSIDYITISSTGNSTEFGELTVVRSQNCGCANA